MSEFAKDEAAYKKNYIEHEYCHFNQRLNASSLLSGLKETDLNYKRDNVEIVFLKKNHTQTLNCGYTLIETFKNLNIIIKKNLAPLFEINNECMRISTNNDKIDMAIQAHIENGTKSNSFSTPKNIENAEVVIKRYYHRNNKLFKLYRFSIPCKEKPGHFFNFDSRALNLRKSQPDGSFAIGCQCYKLCKGVKCRARILIPSNVANNMENFVFRSAYVRIENGTHLLDQCLQPSQFSNKDINRTINIELYHSDRKLYKKLISFVRSNIEMEQ